MFDDLEARFSMGVARTQRVGWLVAGLVLFFGLPAAAQEELNVLSVRPLRHLVSAPADARISVTFDRPVAASSVSAFSFWAFGQWSGPVEGALRLSDGGRTVTLIPERRLSAGERVLVILSNEIEGSDGGSLRGAGYSFQFWVRSRGAGFDFVEIDRFSTRTRPAVSTRAYGGFGSDLDNDGFLDLTIVNEDTSDLRVFLNHADRTGTFRDFLRPPAATGNVPSPSEPGDFDRDGNVDVAVANTRDETVSVLFGNGDGTFGRRQDIGVGAEVRGVTVLDADGDGDLDIAATSFGTGRVVVVFNDGSGTFGGPRFFGTGEGERALAAGDMNDDGILDLVVGRHTAEMIDVYLGRGNGNFALSASQPSAGAVWMLILGDVDGDGDEDVAAVNGPSNNAALLMGDGAGGLSEPVSVPIDPFGLATDLADLDGDGDLDWVTSSFDGDWLWFENTAGSFSEVGRFPATQTASCSLPMDLDNDGVLDLVLIDELEDEVILLKSRAVVFASDFESGDTGDWSKRKGKVRVVAPGLRGSSHALEVTVDGRRKRSFVESRQPSSETSLRVEFDLAVRRVGLADATVEILRLGSGRAAARLTLEQRGQKYRVRVWARDQGTLREVGSLKVPASGRSRLRLEWSSASGRLFADGRVALAKGGHVRVEASALDNFGQAVNRVRLGLPGGSKGADSGSFLIDGYSSTR